MSSTTDETAPVHAEGAPSRIRRMMSGGSLDRAAAFSDAIFSIAMTLLILDIKVPDLGDPSELGTALLELVPRYLTFVLSFAVIGTAWMSHHRKFRVIRSHDQHLLRLNLLLLLVVASLPFPTALLGRYGDEPVAVVVYASAIALMGLLLVAIWLYAWRRGFIDPVVTRAEFRDVLRATLAIPITFLASIPVALLAGASAGEYTWIAAFPLMVLLRRLGR